MKAIPKVNTEGLYIEDTLVDDAFNGVVPFYAELPAAEAEDSPEIDAAEDEHPSELEISGYIVGVPVIPGLYLPRFDLEAWEANSSSDPADYWSEGLTAEEIEALHPPAEPTEMELLMQENTELKLALVELAETNEIEQTQVQLALVELAELITAGKGDEQENG